MCWGRVGRRRFDKNERQLLRHSSLEDAFPESDAIADKMSQFAYAHSMDAVFDILWWLWCPVAALLVQAVAIRLYRPRNAAQETTVGCLAWLASFAVAMLFVSWSGMQLYGFHSDDARSWARWFVLFISPFGLPLLFGAPVVLILKALLTWWKAVTISRRR